MGKKTPTEEEKQRATIPVFQTTKDLVSNRGTTGESYDDVILKLVNAYDELARIKASQKPMEVRVRQR